VRKEREKETESAEEKEGYELADEIDAALVYACASGSVRERVGA